MINDKAKKIYYKTKNRKLKEKTKVLGKLLDLTFGAKIVGSSQKLFEKLEKDKGTIYLIVKTKFGDLRDYEIIVGLNNGDNLFDNPNIFGISASYTNIAKNFLELGQNRNDFMILQTHFNRGGKNIHKNETEFDKARIQHSFDAWEYKIYPLYKYDL